MHPAQFERVISKFTVCIAPRKMPVCLPKIGQNRNLARHFAAFSSSNQALERLAPPNALCVQHDADDGAILLEKMRIIPAK